MGAKTAKIAVSVSTYWIDKPYEYCIPEDLSSAVAPGVRVYVPFSKNNKRSEGIVLSVSGNEPSGRLKSIISVIDSEPVLSQLQIQLALFMRERFFCSTYEAVRCIIPTAMQLNENGRPKIIGNETEYAVPAFSLSEGKSLIEEKIKRAKKQAEIVRLFIDNNLSPLRVKDILCCTSCTRETLMRLVSTGIVTLEKRRDQSQRIPLNSEKLLDIPVLNSEQQAAFDGLSELFNNRNSSSALLFGVTGSGKTAVYVNLIKERLEKGFSSVLLVPEISLTPQMVETFRRYFGSMVAVLHSSLTGSQRLEAWYSIRSGAAKVVVGTRSAVFAPVQNLGLIIIDEEQEDTYKSENSPRYNATDIARFLCYKTGSVLLLGSATPDLCTTYRAKNGQYHYFELSHRYNDDSLPPVSIVDMRRELKKGNNGNISSYLKEEIRENIEKGEQSILFLNRRGSNKCVTCGECGFSYRCPNCSVSLTYHGYTDKLVCHYCGFTRKPDRTCPECGGLFKYIGIGTQLIETELKSLFPDVEILRMDTDVINSDNTHEKLFNRFRNEKIPILIGTQMVSKGLNFNNVTLVGVVSADSSLYSGDYRASERTFSLITQVIGRCGRGDKPGRAVIQTYTPDNETILQAAAQDYKSFYNSEILVRELQNAPPFSDIISVTVTGTDEDDVLRAAEYAADELRASLSSLGGIRILGPAPLSVVKVNNRFRYRVNVYCKSDRTVRLIISSFIVECNKDKRFRSVAFYADSNPLD